MLEMILALGFLLSNEYVKRQAQHLGGYRYVANV